MVLLFDISPSAAPDFGCAHVPGGGRPADPSKVWPGFVLVHERTIISYRATALSCSWNKAGFFGDNRCGFECPERWCGGCPKGGIKRVAAAGFVRDARWTLFGDRIAREISGGYASREADSRYCLNCSLLRPKRFSWRCTVLTDTFMSSATRFILPRSCLM